MPFGRDANVTGRPRIRAPSMECPIIRSVSTRTAIAVLPLLCAALPVPAQADGGAEETILVLGDRRGIATAPTADEARAALSRVAGSTGFVDGEALRDRFATNLRDVLADVPGVYVQTRFGEEVRLSIRGSGISRGYHQRGNELLLDGVPINLADGNGDFQEIDPAAIRHVEIWKGGNGLAYGSAGLGGAINFVTPTGRTAIAPNVVRLDAGSFGSLRATGSLARILGDTDFAVTASALTADGARPHSRQRDARLSANVGLRLSDSVETRFYVNAANVNLDLPGTLSLNDALHAPDQAAPGNLALDQSRNIRSLRIANKWSVVLDDATLEFGGYAFRKTLFHPIFQVIDQKGWFWGGYARITTTGTIAGLRNELVAGMRRLDGDNDAKQFINLAGSRGALAADTRQGATNTDFYFEDRLFVVPTVALVAGARWTRSTRDFDDVRDPRKNATQNFHQLAPKIGVLYQPAPEIQLFANLTRSAEAPGFAELVNATGGFFPVAEQRAWTAEIGTRGKLGKVEWDVTAYRARIDGEMLQYTIDSQIPASTFNAGRTIHQGLEAGASVALLQQLRLHAAWTWSDFRFDGDRQYRNNRIAGVPRHVLRADLRYTDSSGAWVQPSVEYVPQGAWVDYANSVRVPGWTVANLAAGIDLQNGISLFAELRNVTDKRYVSDFSTATDLRGVANSSFYPGEPRSAYAGVRLTW